MFVHYYMTPDPLTIASEMSVAQASELLRNRSFRHLPVVDKEGVLQGMVTDRDLRSACPSSMLEEQERQKILDRVGTLPVSTIMSRKFVSLQASSTLDDALLRFKTRSIGALPVVDSRGRVVGIVSLNDMMAAYRSLFGLGEKGSMLVSIKDSGEPDLLSRLVLALEREKITCTRLVRSAGSGRREPAAIYLRVNTFKLSSVHRIIEDVGCTLLVPDWLEQEQK